MESNIIVHCALCGKRIIESLKYIDWKGRQTHKTCYQQEMASIQLRGKWVIDRRRLNPKVAKIIMNQS